MKARFSQVFLLIVILAALLAVAAAPELYRISAAFNAGDDSYVRNGKDIIWYSDSLSTETARIEGAVGEASFYGLRLTPSTAITVVNGTVITPLGGYQPMNGSGTITAATVATASAAIGDVVILVNRTATTINIADSGKVKLSAAAAIGQYDTLTLLYTYPYWLEIARSNN